MHQGIDKIPDAEILESSAVIKKMKILSGLHHHCAIRFLETGSSYAMG
jgi:hypothetical protein